MPALLDAGHRVVTHDRRGVGRSGGPAFGYDYDTLAGDLHNVTRVGSSMGGGERVERAVFLSSVPPFLQKTPDNPDGVDGGIFDAIGKSIVYGRQAFLSGFLADFCNVDVCGGDGASENVVRLGWNIAAGASPIGTLNCVTAFAATDFRGDLGRIDVPTLIVHGDADRIVPFAVSGKRTHEQVPGSRLVVIRDGPHGIIWTHAGHVNRELLDFLGKKVEAAPAPA